MFSRAWQPPRLQHLERKTTYLYHIVDYIDENQTDTTGESMSRGLFDTVIELGQYRNRSKAERLANRAIQQGFNVKCTKDGWNVFHVTTGNIDRCEAIGIYQRLQRAGFTPVMM